MITVIVTYRVKPGFAAQNKKNIQQFLADFKKLQGGFVYEVFTKDDGNVFVHFSSYKNESIQNEVLNIPSFKEFQRLRDQSGLDGSHKVDMLTYVGSTAESFLDKPATFEP
jgi:quinol monooxygenase YgiN